MWVCFYHICVCFNFSGSSFCPLHKQEVSRLSSWREAQWDMHTHTLIDAGIMRTLVHTQILTAVSLFQSLTRARTHSVYKLLFKSLVKFNRETGCPHWDNEKKKTTPLKKAKDLMKTNNVQMYSCTLRQNACLDTLFTNTLLSEGRCETHLWPLPNLCT